MECVQVWIISGSEISMKIGVMSRGSDAEMSVIKELSDAMRGSSRIQLDLRSGQPGPRPAPFDPVFAHDPDADFPRGSAR